VELSAGIADAAAKLEPPSLRTLDAVHLASALSLGDDLGAFVAYDRRLAEAAEAAGIEVLAPPSDGGRPRRIARRAGGQGPLAGQEL
jgi:uncharacterized protein